ncbi:DNA-protecting protein DprA [Aquabacterium sp. A7-Y]|uniref:DNA-processing protein DprA n=1 Tax=Aquabacterium sp. A7-Y TaxID=1349605 RepID=UPI00223CA996|nr:DNA-processing protein DprA [Aquabacterium sp. A7-Y]MCW7539270.1 DNA-protecting protein DprA [Aquabacterium sp. A7-Y]
MHICSQDESRPGAVDASEVALAAGVLALLRSGRVDAARLRALLIAGADEPGPRADLTLLEAAGVRPGELNATLAQARSEVDQGLALGVVPVTLRSASYPAPLRPLEGSPLLLFVQGAMEVLARLPAVAVVGTRRAGGHGSAIARRLGAALAEAGWTVAAALEPGIAQAALEGALRGGTAPLAILGQGLDKPGPKALRELAERVRAAGGALLSEHPCGMRPRRELLPARHRLEAGLACAGIVVEGAEQSAALGQAEAMLALRRQLFAVLPPSDAGVLTQRALPQLLVQRHGATAIHTREDYPALLAQAAAAAEALRPHAGPGSREAQRC